MATIQTIDKNFKNLFETFSNSKQQQQFEVLNVLIRIQGRIQGIMRLEAALLCLILLAYRI